jgi:hypothetical protein
MILDPFILNVNSIFLFSFCLAKKKQKPKAKDQFQFFSLTKRLRNATEKIAIRSLSPKATAPLLMYDRLTQISAQVFVLLQTTIQ